MAAGFLLSQEFYNNMGKGNVVNWLQSVYLDVLHRTASSGELAYWQTQLSSAEIRKGIAAGGGA